MPSHIRTQRINMPQPKPMMPPQPMKSHVHQRTMQKKEMFGFLNQRIRFMKQEISIMNLIIFAVIAYLLYKYCIQGKGIATAPKSHLQYFFF